MSSEIVVERRSPLPVSAEEASAWFARPGALERLTPPWRPYPGHPVHRVEPDPNDPRRSTLSDRVTSEAKGGVTERELHRLLRYRHAVAAGDLAMHARVAAPPMHIGITGGSGFIGTMLIPMLTAGGHRVTRLVRRSPGAGEIQWGGGVGGRVDPAELEGLGAIVHLAGAPIGRRWTAARKQEIRDSRVLGTREIAGAMAQAKEAGGPGVLVSTSAIGIYGDRGDRFLTEASQPGIGFLPAVATDWEQATEPAELAGIRVVRLRLGLPLSPAGGVLERMLAPFRLGLGGRLGGGRQWMSWIGADDLLEVVHLALVRDTLRGPVNTVGPNPLRNAELTRVLARVLHRPAVLSVPRVALRLRFGEMANATILASARVTPYVLQGMGHRFRHETAEAALRHVLGRAGEAAV